MKNRISPFLLDDIVEYRSQLFSTNELIHLTYNFIKSFNKVISI